MIARLDRPRTAHVVAVGVVVALVYAWLCSALKVDDVDRYWHELGANSFFWDLGHLWMQPLAMLLYRASGGVLGVNHTLEAINVLSVALGCAIFFATLREAGHSALKSAAAVAFVAVSFNMITLGPTAHIKLMVFPTLAMGLRHALRWERAEAADHPTLRDMVASAAWLVPGLIAISDSARAARVGPNTSRATARASVGPTHAPTPCMKRNHRSCSTVVERLQPMHAATNNTVPPVRMGLRP